MTITRPRRPLGITIVAIIILIFTLWNGLRLAGAIFFWRTLMAYHSVLGPIYQVLTGGIWFFSGLYALWCLWSGNRHGKLIGFTFSFVYGLWFWLDRLIVQVTIDPNWPFILSITLLLMLLITLNLFSRSASRYFQREAYESTAQNQEIEGTKS